MARCSACRDADEVAVGHAQVELIGRAQRRVGARETCLQLALVRAAVAVLAVAVVARLGGELDRVAAGGDAAAGAAIGLEAARAGTTVAVDDVAVVARLGSLLVAIAANGAMTPRRLGRVGDDGRGVADKAGLELARRRAARADRGGIALLDAAEHAVTAPDLVDARHSRPRTIEVVLDHPAVAGAAVTRSGVAVVACFAEPGIEPAVATSRQVGIAHDLHVGRRVGRLAVVDARVDSCVGSAARAPRLLPDSGAPRQQQHADRSA